jgi:hypothetical protein
LVTVWDLKETRGHEGAIRQARIPKPIQDLPQSSAIVPQRPGSVPEPYLTHNATLPAGGLLGPTTPAAVLSGELGQQRRPGYKLSIVPELLRLSAL